MSVRPWLAPRGRGIGGRGAGRRRDGVASSRRRDCSGLLRRGAGVQRAGHFGTVLKSGQRPHSTLRDRDRDDLDTFRDRFDVRREQKRHVQTGSATIDAALHEELKRTKGSAWLADERSPLLKHDRRHNLGCRRETEGELVRAYCIVTRMQRDRRVSPRSLPRRSPFFGKSLLGAA